MPYLVFEDDETKTAHVVRNLDTAPPRAVIALQHETGWELKKIRDEIQGADFYAGILMAYLTTAAAGRPVSWDFLMDTPMAEWPWEMKATQSEKDAAETPGDEPADAADPQQPRSDSSPAGDAPEHSEG